MDRTEVIKQLIHETGLSFSAFSKKANIPNTTLHSMLSRGIGNASVDNVLKVCKALGITIEDLDNNDFNKPFMLAEEPATYYLDKETQDMVQEIHDNKELQILFDASRKLNPDDIKMITEMVKRFKKD